jgi:hypothetical protein
MAACGRFSSVDATWGVAINTMTWLLARVTAVKKVCKRAIQNSER